MGLKWLKLFNEAETKLDKYISNKIYIKIIKNVGQKAVGVDKSVCDKILDKVNTYE